MNYDELTIEQLEKLKIEYTLLAEYNDLLSRCYKRSNNSLYGAISNPYSRFYTLDCAKSITGTGREITKFQAHIADKILDKI